MRVSVSLEQDPYRRAVEQAEREQRSLASYVRWALVRYLTEVEDADDDEKSSHIRRTGTRCRRSRSTLGPWHCSAPCSTPLATRTSRRVVHDTGLSSKPMDNPFPNRTTVAIKEAYAPRRRPPADRGSARKSQHEFVQQEHPSLGWYEVVVHHAQQSLLQEPDRDTRRDRSDR